MQLTSYWCNGHRVEYELPKVEVRFQDLRVQATAESAGRALPSIWNSYRNTVEVG